jgi:type VI secretion system protein ImpK
VLFVNITGESTLIARFREFYSEVVQLKRMVESGSWSHSGDDDENLLPSPVRAATSVQQRLVEVIERQDRTKVSVGDDLGASVLDDARYLMVVLADEVFLLLDWEGREPWRDNLLESRFFGSHAAGEIVFDQLERLLQARDPAYADLAKVYLFVLALGFEGRYRGTNDRRELSDFRRRTFSLIARREPNLLDETRQLFPDAYAFTLDQGTERRLPPIRKWVGALAISCLLFLIFGHVLWTIETAQLKSVSQEILQSG